jgi:hypothetical protein
MYVAKALVSCHHCNYVPYLFTRTSGLSRPLPEWMHRGVSMSRPPPFSRCHKIVLSLFHVFLCLYHLDEHQTQGQLLFFAVSLAGVNWWCYNPLFLSYICLLKNTVLCKSIFISYLCLLQNTVLHKSKVPHLPSTANIKQKKPIITTTATNKR